MMRIRECLVLLVINGLFVSTAMAGPLEDAYQKYQQGRYEEAHQDLNSIIDSQPTPEEAYNMQENIGLRAFLDMAQNQFLSTGIRRLSYISWQFERNQFKSARRVDYYLEAYLNDKSVRAKALANLVASGEYSIPGLVENLGQKQVDVVKRGLSYQALLRIGREAVGGLVVATYSEDTILLVNIIRLFGEFLDPRSLPYLARLNEVHQDEIVRRELARVLAMFPDISETNSNLLLIAEANRYIREDQAAIVESLTCDGLVWSWNTDEKRLEAVNLLGQEYEFLPSLPPNLWPLFRAEMIQHELQRFNGALNESVFARASLLAAWAAQENRVSELLRDTERSKVDKMKEPLQKFLQRRELEVEVMQWAGTETLLTAIDMAARGFDPFVAARLLQVATVYHPPRLLEMRVISFIDGVERNPVLDALDHKHELVRYWAAIAAGRADPALAVESQPLIIDLLAQAADEVYINSVLLVSEPSQEAEGLKKALSEIGYKVYHENSGFDGLNALREFPSKDFVIVAQGLMQNLSSIEFVTRLKKDYKGHDLPLAIFAAEAEKPAAMAAFQDHSQQLILHGEMGEVLKEKMEELKRHRKEIVSSFRKDIVLKVSLEALGTMKALDDGILRSYPVVVNHLNDLLSNPFHEREHEVAAIQVLAKFGELAFSTTPVLLDKLWDKTEDHAYQLEILATMRYTSRTHPKAREALYKLVSNHAVERSIRIQAASYLGLDTDQSAEEEKRVFQRPFLTREYPSEGERSGM